MKRHVMLSDRDVRHRMECGSVNKTDDVWPLIWDGAFDVGSEMLHVVDNGLMIKLGEALES